MPRLSKLLIATILIACCAFGQKIQELNTILMESTFKIQGPKKGEQDHTAFGTAFLVAKPKAVPAVGAYYVLVTAAHVLDDIDGDLASILMRRKNPDGSFTTSLYAIAIRREGHDLYVKHEDYAKDTSADAAALYVNMPDDFTQTILATTFLADDNILEDFEVHPGDELFCLGFPLYVGTDSGFPILRSGTLSSYPITPTTIHKRMLFDIAVFDGNSGGPVYLVDRDRIYKGSVHLGGPIQFLVGLLKGQVTAAYYNNEKISLAVVVPSRYIIETISRLPPESPYK